MNDILFAILQVLAMSAIAAILRYLIPYLIQVLRDHNYNFAATIVEKLVRAAEQTMIGQKRGDEQFEWVIRMAKSQLTKYNITISDDQLIQLLEAAVETINENKYLMSNEK